MFSGQKYGVLTMIIKLNESFSKSAAKLKLNILTAGYGEIDEGWGGEVINTPYSRFYFVLEGEFFITTESGEKFYFKRGNAYLIPSGLSYRFGCDTKMKHVYFHIQLCASDKIDLLGEIPFPISLPQSSVYTADEIISLTLSQDSTDSFKMESELRKALCDMLAFNKISLEKNEYSPEIKNAISFIDNNLSIALDIPQIAKAVGFAKSTLTRRFRLETGMSVNEYIDKMIMFKAERALLSSDASILEISESFGFCDQFYFSRRFKEKYGTSPREYRKKTNI